MDFKIYNSDTYWDSFDLVLEQLKRNYSNAKSVQHLIIVPDRNTLNADRRMFEKLNITGTFNIRVLSFSQLVSEYSKKDSKDKKNVLTQNSSTILIKKILLEIGDDLKVFSRASKQIGFAKNLLETINILKRSNIAPQEFENSYKGDNEAVANKISDIALIYKKYQEITKSDYHETYNMFSKMINTLHDSQESKNTFFYLGLFDMFSQQEYLLIKRLIKHSRGVYISYPYNTNNKSVILNEMHENLNAIAISYNIKFADITKYKVAHPGNIQKHILNSVSNFSSETSIKKLENIGQDSTIQFFRAKNIEQEVEMTCLNIKRQVIHEGLRYNDINICVPDINTYKPYIKKMFEQHDIPYFIDDKTKVIEHEVSKYVLSALRCVSGHFEKEDVLSFLSNYFTDLDNKHYNVFENYVLANDISYDAFFSKGIHNNFFKVFGSNVFENIVDNKMLKLQKISAETGDEVKKNSKYFIDWIRSEMLNKKTEEKISELALRYKKQNNAVDYKITLQVLDKIDDILNNLELILEKNELTLMEFIGFLSTTLESATLSVIPLEIDSTFIGSVRNNNFSERKVLLVLGGIEGETPKHFSDSGIITEDEIKRTNKSKEINPTLSEINKVSKFNFMQLVSSASDSIIFSYPQYYSDSINEGFSIFINLIKDVFTHNEEKLSNLSYSDFFSNKDENIDLTALFYSNYKVALNKYIDFIRGIEDGNLSTNKDFVEVLEEILKFEYGEVEIEKFKAYLNYSKQYPEIDNAQDLFFKDQSVSASQINRYFTCPFLHFIDYGLRLKEKRLKPLDKMIRGNFIHSILEEFGKKLKENTLNYFNDTQLEVSIAEVLHKVERSDEYSRLFKINKMKPVITNMRKQATILMININNQFKNSKFDIKDIETNFNKNTFKETYFNNEGNKLYLKGKVDRVDMFENFFRVIDYKTGKDDTINAPAVYYGTNLQLLFYLAIIQSVYKEKNPAGIFYSPVKKYFNDNDDDSQSSISDSFAMKGILLAEDDAIKAMDKNARTEYTSPFIKGLKFNKFKEKSLFKNLDKRYADQYVESIEFKLLIKYLVLVTQKAIDEINKGYIEASPILKTSSNPCEYCKANKSCMFYNELGCSPRKISDHKFKFSELFELLKTCTDSENKDPGVRNE